MARSLMAGASSVRAWAPSSLAATDRWICTAAVVGTCVGARLQRSRAGLAGGTQGCGQTLIDQLAHLRVLQAIGAHGFELHGAVAVEHAARANVPAGQRLIEAAHRLAV